MPKLMAAPTPEVRQNLGTLVLGAYEKCNSLANVEADFEDSGSMGKQNDTIRYVNDAIKEETEVSAFCKESIGKEGKGAAYWYDGDSTIGLYKEITNVEFVKRKGKGRLT
ncbi:hypothetical protein GIB67_039079 [Kingdonia uniflora]|uniref:Uncharacterized protein n=1 Tax=Kingdonia uniflora TaxID=39325 RepID=A0A7J7LKW9_9MAGN|nr:hypothetical protein GIB67_039079 [Kingdonia uniflora]